MWRMLAGVVACVAVGFGLGWAAFSWQPWESSPSEHDAQVAVLKATRMASAGCRQREYPETVFDCEAQSANGCANVHYAARFTGDGFYVERQEGGPLILAPVGC